MLFNIVLIKINESLTQHLRYHPYIFWLDGFKWWETDEPQTIIYFYPWKHQYCFLRNHGGMIMLNDSPTNQLIRATIVFSYSFYLFQSLMVLQSICFFLFSCQASPSKQPNRAITRFTWQIDKSNRIVSNIFSSTYLISDIWFLWKYQWLIYPNLLIAIIRG